MAEYILNSEFALSEFIGQLRDEWHNKRWLKVKVTSGQKRSLDQNAIFHAWMNQAALEDRQHDALGHKAYCKLHHAVPILRAEDEEFRAFYDGALKGRSYEQKLAAMKFVPATSLMTKPQLSSFLEAVQSDYSSRGVRLEFPQA